MLITKRQEEILKKIIEEYVHSVQPISSQLLEKKFNFKISPATIRAEMHKLTEKGFLSQPHTSAGRVPTDKGYRFLVNNLLEKKEEVKEKDEFDKLFSDFFKSEINDRIKFIQSLTRNLAQFSESLVVSYFEKEKFFWKEGWEEILRVPEFEEKDYLVCFTEFLRNFEKNIDNLGINSEVRIYIGKESRFPKSNDFTIISSKCQLMDGQETILSILGPKRMAYDKNINLINSLIDSLEEIK